jgi:uncharacterized glyoxalase superfamily protein PhnB
VKTNATVSVTVDPQTAFTAFTDEIDLWYVRGPINYFDLGRAVGMRCERGVGGRLIEVYDEATGEGLELARITAWEPGQRLAWTSSIDDVLTEIRFRADGQGTEITVEAFIPDGGRSEGGAAWVRIVPRWFPAWCERRDAAGRPQPELGRLAVGLYYAEPIAAARWLADVFGLRSYNPLPEGPEGGDGPQWIEFRVGSGSVILYPGGHREAGPTHETWIYVDDLDAHYKTAKAGGATIVNEIKQHGYRAYSADDLESHRWTFVQAGPHQ